VQTGDCVDRGPHSVAVLQLMWRLQEEAAAAGGEVRLLLGNHEAWALGGENAFAGEEELQALGNGSAADGRRVWDALFDARGGELGVRVASGHAAAALLGEGGCRTLFVHAGLSLAFLRRLGGEGEGGVAERLNSRLTAAASAAAAGTAWPDADPGLFADGGPFWYRGYALGSENAACRELAAVLQEANASRMLVGHTVQARGARARCGGALVLLDAGVSEAYYGRPTAWECADGRAAVVEAGGRRLLPTPGEAGR